MKRLLSKMYDYFRHRYVTRNRYWLWYCLTFKRNNAILSELAAHYSLKQINNQSSYKGVICIYEGAVFQGGLADRLRGILSVYKTCKEEGVDFCLYFMHPFKLEWFLIPNIVDWHIEEHEIISDLSKLHLLVLDSTSDSNYSKRKQEQYIKKHISVNKEKQIHCYTNVCYSYDYNYAELFWELFRLSPRLASSIERQKKEIGGPYISISARFLDSLGDFNESFGFNHPLSSQERDSLIKSNLYQIEKLHAAYPAHRILVNSDSITFLSEAARLSYVYVNPGIITHIDNTASASYETFEKTFLDYFMIANAEHIYLLKTKWMHRSGYPYAASLIYAKPFDVIEF